MTAAALEGGEGEGGIGNELGPATDIVQPLARARAGAARVYCHQTRGWRKRYFMILAYNLHYRHETLQM